MEFVDGLSTLRLDNSRVDLKGAVDVTEPKNPDHWQEAMDRVGLSSRTRLGIAAGVPTSTVTGLITGDRESREETIQKVAAALRVEVTTIRTWAAQARGESEPYSAPPEANRLSRRQRKALDELIRSIVAAADEVPPLAGPEPATVHEYGLAARLGHSEGKQLRQDLDAQAEAPDYDPGFDES